ncbi:uncharacterized protein LOC119833190 [Zerene cesonia]|uniref:uncharacterized protein LOC119833190 n=1 Tax=Zerene cesonia TaxID=33412 RepID=UPI0018E4EE91|nr:uncharacterized protein LOC119833190 [Zerene cesonia]
MIIYLTICNIFFISFASSNSISPLPIKTVSNQTDSSTSLQLHEQHNKTKLIIPSEGGTLLTNLPVTLAKDNQPLLLSLDKDQVKNKEKSVVARKGVKYVPKDDSSLEHDNSIQNVDNKTVSIETTLFKNATKPLSNIGNVPNAEKLPPITKIHKPLVLSSELLDKSGQTIEIEPNIRVNKINENSRPDLIMPIVITILVVPMFAVVGYMALKRGKEAWKNRHYKRMDFLLDGMYND